MRKESALFPCIICGTVIYRKYAAEHIDKHIAENKAKRKASTQESLSQTST